MIQNQKLDWDLAKLCSEISGASYLPKDEFKEFLLSKNIKTIPRMFDNNGAEAYCFRLNADTVVISFRGTEIIADNWSDVLADIKAWPTSSDTAGDIHAGFKGHVDKIYPSIYAYIKSRFLNRDRDTILVTGHSLGGAMAAICASRLYQHRYKVKLFTYGCPRVGSKTWAEQFANIEAYRFQNNNDIVCTVPPFGLYSHVGQLYYMDYAGHIHKKISTWARIWDSIRGRIKAYSKLEIFDSIYDHDITRYKNKIEQNIQR